MATLPMSLRVDSGDGSSVEEYRIYEGIVEVRRQQDSRDPESGDNRHRLTHSELAAHVRDNTVVAQWLKHRIGWRRLLRACTNPQTLEEFGIPADTLDRYAA